MILLCALPSATISGMFANEAGAYRDEAATSILVSAVRSVLTFPPAIYLSIAVFAPERVFSPSLARTEPVARYAFLPLATDNSV
jgi:hypothetical protein